MSKLGDLIKKEYANVIEKQANSINESKVKTIIREEFKALLEKAEEKKVDIGAKLESMRKKLIKDGNITIFERGSARNNIEARPERRIDIKSVSEIIGVPINDLTLHFLNGHRIHEGQELVEYRLGQVYFYGGAGLKSVNEGKEEALLHETSAGEEAKRRGLTAKPFGNYADKSGKVVAKSVDGKLVNIGGKNAPKPTSPKVSPSLKGKVAKGISSKGAVKAKQSVPGKGKPNVAGVPKSHESGKLTFPDTPESQDQVFAAIRDFTGKGIPLKIAARNGQFHIEYGNAAQSNSAGSEILPDFDTRKVNVGGKEVPLSKMEFNLLNVLRDNVGRTISKKEMLEMVWKASPDVITRTVDMYVSRLRSKLGEHGRYIQTVRGLGYRFNPPKLGDNK